jgi:hypothetical protein
MKLKMFSIKSELFENESYVTMLYPFWGIRPEPLGDKDEGRFDEYSRIGENYFSLVTALPESDIAVLPYEWKSEKQWKSKYKIYVEDANRIAEEARMYGKPLIIFFNNDSEEVVPVKNSIIFRTSFTRSKRRKNEFAFPGWSVDFLSRYRGGNLSIRKKPEVPTVGYCGYVDYVQKNIKNLVLYKIRTLRWYSQNIGVSIRGAAVRSLLQDSRINTNFIYREKFGGLMGNEARNEYVNNIFDSDYLLVARGAGNFSYRFYEVLSSGRIPIFIDTDCVLPFDHIIDWKKYCIWVDSKDLMMIGEKVLKFHDNISGKDYEELQCSVRNLYERWICPVGFYNNLWRCLI